jgi:hypothetical protein
MESLHAKAGGGSFLAAVLRTRETKNVFTFVCALGAYACVQGVYGIYIDSLGACSRWRWLGASCAAGGLRDTP